jgi:wyosine [tRNA(Phe)-imidazoG37] synthetase (radical SAM superfamily)
MNSYVFGPVPSRRLGRSLGVDLLPHKACSFDCVYCQLGKTTRKTLERAPWVPVDTLIEQIREKLPTCPDYITLGGSGEPTLHSGIGDLISRIREMTDIPVAILTNGSLLWQKEVRDQIMRADLLLPSLDAGDAATFAAVNLPHPDLRFDLIVQGLVDLRREYRGPIWLEVLLVDGINATHPALDRIVSAVERIMPDRIQINTVVRPPAEPGTRGLSRRELEQAARRFGPLAAIVADVCQATVNHDPISGQQEEVTGQQEVLAILRRHPSSMEDLERALGMHRDELMKQVNRLVAEGSIQAETIEGRTYYMVRVYDVNSLSSDQ